MELLPNFQIGIYNTYIAMIILILTTRIIAKFTNSDLKRAHTFPPMNSYEKAVYYTWLGLFAFILLISFLIPFVYTKILFPIGVIFSFIGLLIFLFSKFTYETTPKEKLITTGLYKISRNPGYFSNTLYLIGVSFMANSIFLLGLSILFFLFYQVAVTYEERMCEDIYKEEFIEYKNNTPKNFLFF